MKMVFSYASRRFGRGRRRTRRPPIKRRTRRSRAGGARLSQRKWRQRKRPFKRGNAIDITRAHLMIAPVAFKTMMWVDGFYLSGNGVGTCALQTYSISSLYNPNYSAWVLSQSNRDSSVRGLSLMNTLYQYHRVNGVVATISATNCGNTDIQLTASVRKSAQPENNNNARVMAKAPRAVNRVLSRAAAGNMTSSTKMKLWIPFYKLHEMSKLRWMASTIGEAPNQSEQTGSGGLTFLHLQSWNLSAGGQVISNVNDQTSTNVAQFGDGGNAHVGSGLASLRLHVKLKFYVKFSGRRELGDIMPSAEQ